MVVSSFSLTHVGACRSRHTVEYLYHLFIYIRSLEPREKYLSVWLVWTLLPYSSWVLRRSYLSTKSALQEYCWISQTYDTWNFRLVHSKEALHFPSCLAWVYLYFERVSLSVDVLGITDEGYNQLGDTISFARIISVSFWCSPINKVEAIYTPSWYHRYHYIRRVGEYPFSSFFMVNSFCPGHSGSFLAYAHPSAAVATWCSRVEVIRGILGYWTKYLSQNNRRYGGIGWKTVLPNTPVRPWGLIYQVVVSDSGDRPHLSVTVSRILF